MLFLMIFSHLNNIYNFFFAKSTNMTYDDQTFYGHFVAGEDQEKIKPVISRMHSFGVKSILDYSVEEDMAEEKDKKEKNEKQTWKGVNI